MKSKTWQMACILCTIVLLISIGMNAIMSLTGQNDVVIGIFLGIFITMAFLNVLIYFFFREKTYLYYAFYQIAMFLFQWASLGRSPHVNQSLFSSLMLMASLVFVKSFLNTKENTPKHHRLINGLIGALLCNMAFAIIGYTLQTTVATDLLGVAIAGITLTVAVLCVRKNVNQSKYFLYAWLILIMGGLIFIMRNWGIIPHAPLIQYIMLISGVGESLLIFTALVDRTKMLTKEKYEALRRVHIEAENRKSAELAFLKAQIKPHFLYNTLSVIMVLIRKEPDRATKMLHNLSNYLRGSFHFEYDNGMTLLSQEIETIKAYLAIEKERFQHQLMVEYDIEEMSHVTIPLLTIQPLVENALRHGIFMQPGGGLIRIIIKRQPKGLFIRVEDNGVGMTKEKRHEIQNQSNGNQGIGLWNINERLMLYYGETLAIESQEGVGTSVSFTIPMGEGV